MTARALIDRAVKTLEEKLLEESLVVALVCLAFLLHLRSALVAIVILPIAVLIAFLVMFGQGISSNIMSLGGIAIAIGAMVDAVIIMIENAHKHLERDRGKKPHWEIIRDAADRGRADAFLFAAGDHRVLPAGVHAAGAGGADVQAAGVHQDLFDGARRRCSPSRSRRSSWVFSSAAKFRRRKRIPSTAFSSGSTIR